MFKTVQFLLYILSILLSTCTCNGDRIKDSMYQTIEGSVACYRRMNATHQIGCSSDRGGSLGVIHYCDSLEDLDFILKVGPEQYIPILPAKLFNGKTVDKLIANIDKVKGVILHSNNETLSEFSHEDQCPNQRFGVPGTQCPQGGWNPLGTGLLYRDLPFPMFYVSNHNDIQLIKDCFQKYNNYSIASQRKRSLCSLELSSFMIGTTNTPTCRRRSQITTNINPVKFCDPLGDNNVWGTLFPFRADHNYIVVAARLDTTSMFDKTAGAESPVTGLVALLSVARLLKEMIPINEENFATNVLFVLFNGETYDYIGSQRMFYDMENGFFPNDSPSDGDDQSISIYPGNISLFVELSQLAKTTQLFAHSLTNDDKVVKFIDYLSQNNPAGKSVKYLLDSLPPSSLHTFIRGDSSIKGLLLTDHEQAYRNPFYNSIYDTASNINYKYFNGSTITDDSIQKYIGDLATMVAKSLYLEIVGANYTGKAVANVTIIDELFYCYLKNPNCKVHRAVQQSALPKSPVSLYVGVDTVGNAITGLVGFTLAWFTGNNLGSTGPNCTNNFTGLITRVYNMSVSIDQLDTLNCYKAVVDLKEAVSPAFIIDRYNWSSNKYSSWTESTWSNMGMRMFLKPSAAHEWMTLVVGVINLIFSFAIVYCIRSKCHILFDYPVVEDNHPTDC